MAGVGIQVGDVLPINMVLVFLVMPNHGDDGGGVKHANGQRADVHLGGESTWRRDIGDLHHHKPDGDPGGGQQHVRKDPVIAAHGINAGLQFRVCCHVFISSRNREFPKMKTKYLPFNKRLLLVETHALFWCGIRRLSSQPRPIQVQKDGFVGRSAPRQRCARPRSGKVREGLAASGFVAEQ